MYDKLNYKIGDILNCTEDILVHQVNTRGIMGAGLALQLRNLYPLMYSGYKSWCDGKEDLLGEVHFYFHDPKRTGNPVRIIASVFAQNSFGRDKNKVYTDYDALREGLLKVSQMSRRMKLTTAIPYGLGCGLANGDWNIVLPMIESHETFVNRFTTIYKLPNA